MVRPDTLLHHPIPNFPTRQMDKLAAIGLHPSNMPRIHGNVVAAQRRAELMGRCSSREQHILYPATAKYPIKMPFTLALSTPSTLFVPGRVNILGTNKLTVEHQLLGMFSERARGN